MVKRFRKTDSYVMHCMTYGLVVLLMVGCSHLPNNQPTETFQIIESQTDRYAYGHGFGDSRESALRAARDELAEMILVNVRTETRQDLRETADQEVTREFASSSFSWSNVSLENTRVDFEQRLRTNSNKRNEGEYYVRLRIDRPTLERLTQLARQKAPALNAVYQIEKLPLTQPALRLAGVIQGDNIASRDQVFKQDFLTNNGSSASFETYFKEVTEASVRALKAIPILSPISKGSSPDIAFVLLHRETATPQRNAQFYVRSSAGPNAGREYELTTNSQGVSRYLSRAELGDHFTVVMKVADRMIDGAHMEQFREIDRYSYANITKANETTVYFYLNPGEANLRLNNESLGTPVRYNLTPGTSYLLQVRAERYREQSEQLVIPKGAAYAFYSAELEARQYGHLNLSVRGRGNSIHIRRDLQEWQMGNGETIEQAFAEAGSYVARVGRGQGQEFDPDYQILQDLFELEHEQTYSQVYPAPLYRNPYKHGWGVSLHILRAGGEPGAKYRVPYLRSGSATATGQYGQFKRDAGQNNNFHLGSAEDFILNVQRYFDPLNFTMQASAGLRNHKFLRPSHASGFSDEDLELNSLVGSFGAGFWYSFYSGIVLTSITVNQAYEYAKWNHDSDVFLQLANNEWAILPSTGGKSNRYLFGEANALFSLGEGVGLSLSVIVPFETRQPLIQLGVSYSFFESGYRKPAIINYTH